VITVGPTLDAESLARLHATSFDDAWSALFMGALLVQPGVTALITPQQDPVGFILIRIAADEAEILTLAVAPSARRGGFGLALLKAALGLMADQNVTRCFLEVAADNAAARALYERAGFSPCGRRAEYYARDQARADALVMELRLQPATELAR
jgi:ribosomal-protein-alanine N-acetyltransferase